MDNAEVENPLFTRRSPPGYLNGPSMSLCYKLLALENGIPFKNVHASWGQSRRQWPEVVAAETDCALSLASLGLELLFVMMPDAV